VAQVGVRELVVRMFAHIGLAEFFRAQAGQQRGENEREISFSPIGLAFRFPILRDSFKECFDRGAGESLGERLGGLRSSGSHAEVFPESDQRSQGRAFAVNPLLINTFTSHLCV